MEEMKLSLDRENILEFNVDIQGYSNTSTNTLPQVRLVLEQKNMGFSMLAKKDQKNYSVTIPEMKNILESGVCEARMEVIIDNKYFVPWQSQIEFDKEVKVEAAPIVKREPEVTMSVEAQPVLKEEPAVEEKVEEVIEEEIPAPKKKSPVQIIVDNKPKRKRKIKKQNTDIDGIINDLSLLAKQIR